MRYLVTAADADRRCRVRDRLRAAGHETVTSYPEEAGQAGRPATAPPTGAVDWGDDGVGLADDAVVVVTLGGDGAVLYSARQFGDPTLLPVRTGDSVGGRIDVEADELLDRIDRLEAGDYRLERHRKLGAVAPPVGTDGTDDPEPGGLDAPAADWSPVGDGIGALNDYHLHHGSPVRSAKFRLSVRDGDRELFRAERVIGNGVLVATPFGSTGYFRSITDGSLRRGVGVALNNCHRPAGAPAFWGLSAAGRVRVEPVATTAGVSPVLARDDDGDTVELAPGRPVELRLTDRTVGVVRF